MIFLFFFFVFILERRNADSIRSLLFIQLAHYEENSYFFSNAQFRRFEITLQIYIFCIYVIVLRVLCIYI